MSKARIVAALLVVVAGLIVLASLKAAGKSCHVNVHLKKKLYCTSD